MKIQYNLRDRKHVLSIVSNVEALSLDELKWILFSSLWTMSRKECDSLWVFLFVGSRKKFIMILFLVISRGVS